MDTSLIFTADAHEEGAWIDILDINMEKTPIRIHVVGKDSKRFQQIEDDAHRRYLESDRKDEVSVEERLAAMTNKWENVPDPTKGPEWVDMEFSKENAILFYQKAPVIREQVNRAINNRANFMKTSPQE